MAAALENLDGLMTNLGITGQNDTNQKLQESSGRLMSLLERADVADKWNKEENSNSSVTTKKQDLKNDNNENGKEWDWSSTYRKYEDYEDLDEIQTAIQKEHDIQEKLLEQHNPSQHYHDHSAERKFFELPEKEKMKQCERYRALGNGLYKEGLLPKAAHLYKTAISYYEYCFPKDNDEQSALDELRYACLCNISLCFHRMGELRESLEAASKVLRAKPTHAKALFRRACVYRALDEYDAAQADLTTALKTCPEDKALLLEQEALFMQIKGSRTLEREVTSRILDEQADKEKILPIAADLPQLRHVLSSDLPMEPFMPKGVREIVI
jgi:tetratricopeptide (TPR) repeat protein